MAENTTIDERLAKMIERSKTVQDAAKQAGRDAKAARDAETQTGPIQRVTR